MRLVYIDTGRVEAGKGYSCLTVCMSSHVTTETTNVKIVNLAQTEFPRESVEGGFYGKERFKAIVQYTDTVSTYSQLEENGKLQDEVNRLSAQSLELFRQLEALNWVWQQKTINRFR